VKASVWFPIIVVYSNFCHITHRLREMTLKYRQGHRQSYHLKAVVWFLISKFSFCGRIMHGPNFRDIGRGNGNICWSDLQISFKVIEHGRPTDRKLEYGLLLVVYSNFRRITYRFRYTSCFNAENLPQWNNSAYPSCIWSWIWRSCRWNVETKFGARKRIIHGAAILFGEVVMIVGQTMMDQSTSVTDRQTNGQTGRFTMTKSALCIASRGKNCQMFWGGPALQHTQHIAQYDNETFYWNNHIIVSEYVGLHDTVLSSFNNKSTYKTV